jgi:osmotically-inducible protein OsmY
MSAEYPKSYDQSLIDSIQKKLWGHTEVFSQHVEIMSLDGLTTLTGKVSNLEDKATLEALVASVPGVSDVINLLEIEKDLSSNTFISLLRKEP